MSVLDAGCGTGRVAIELAARGLDVVGSDIDAQMLAQAHVKAPELAWVESDLGSLNLGRTFDVVVMAGNVILFVEPGNRRGLCRGCSTPCRRRRVSDRWLLVGAWCLDERMGRLASERWLGTIRPLQQLVRGSV